MVLGSGDLGGEYAMRAKSSLRDCCMPAQLCLTLLGPMDCSPPGSSVWIPSKNTEEGCHLLLLSIFLTQGLNLCLLLLPH